MPPTQLCNYANLNFTLPYIWNKSGNFKMYQPWPNDVLSKSVACPFCALLSFWTLIHRLGPWCRIGFQFPATIDIQSLLRVDVDYKCQYVTGWLQPGVYQGVFHNPWESRKKTLPHITAHCIWHTTNWMVHVTSHCTLHVVQLVKLSDVNRTLKRA